MVRASLWVRGETRVTNQLKLITPVFLVHCTMCGAPSSVQSDLQREERWSTFCFPAFFYFLHSSYAVCLCHNINKVQVSFRPGSALLGDSREDNMRTVAQQMLRTCNKLMSRKTPNDVIEAHPSNIETAAQMDNIQHLPSPPQAPSVRASVRHVETVERAHHGGGWLLSGIICINILILGCALVSGSAFNIVAITPEQRQIFLIILLLLTMLWILFYTVFTSRKDQAVLFKDRHAGPVWLRAGLLLFGFLSFLIDIFKIASYVGYLHCDSAVKVAFPVVQAVFLFVQTYFLWIHAKDCVELHTNLTRCGLTLTLSTNLVVWMTAVTEESIHQTEIPDLNVSVSQKMYKASYVKCTCSHSMCDTFKEASYYLYPFNIEYSLFASAMTYVMWKNVGRIVDDHSHYSVKFRPKDVCLGPVTGILLVVVGVVTFIVYKVDILKEDEKRNHALLIHFIMNIVIVSMMCLSTVIGCIIYRLDHREHVWEKNPTRSLDVGLLVGASLGQFIISYFSIVAEVATGAQGYLKSLNLFWAVLMVLQLSLQNYFIIEGLHREPFRVMQEAALHTNAHAIQEHEMSVVLKSRKSSYFLTSSCGKPPWKRRVLKEVCAFLLLGNVILWIMPAFGARPQFAHPIEIKFYTFTMWATIVNIGGVLNLLI
ncbi:proton channel OTOP2 isoform X2 [Etheostoma spectabile]|uniref:proton channel OTOP2 isoform X2 n=1 Tax=Etheostoma spectabile TaxID=54343 RepID=UPI0013AEF5C0|nr:proton channel OTOP2-like isoform X2 [Etheostoma spectabile]